MSNGTNNGGPAFPGQWYDFQPLTGEQVVREQWGGMTLRDYFAAKAMQGMIGILRELSSKCDGAITEAHIAVQAYAFADAMLTERERTEETTHD